MLKQNLNAIFMYLYLRYYLYKIRTDTRFMMKEAIKYGTASLIPSRSEKYD